VSGDVLHHGTHEEDGPGRGCLAVGVCLSTARQKSRASRPGAWRRWRRWRRFSPPPQQRRDGGNASGRVAVASTGINRLRAGAFRSADRKFKGPFTPFGMHAGGSAQSYRLPHTPVKPGSHSAITRLAPPPHPQPNKPKRD